MIEKISLTSCRFACELKVYEGFNTQKCNPISTAMEIQFDEAIANGDFFCSPNIARQLKVLCISRFVPDPTPSFWLVVFRNTWRNQLKLRKIREKFDAVQQ